MQLDMKQRVTYPLYHGVRSLRGTVPLKVHVRDTSMQNADGDSGL